MISYSLQLVISLLLTLFLKYLFQEALFLLAVGLAIGRDLKLANILV